MEAKLCLQHINCPPVHHELVKQALRLALEEASQTAAVVDLLGCLANDGYISETQLQKVMLIPYYEPSHLQLTQAETA